MNRRARAWRVVSDFRFESEREWESGRVGK